MYLLKSIFIHYNIFLISFILDISHFLTNLSNTTSFPTTYFPFLFIIDLEWDLGHWGTMLWTYSSWKSSWRKTSPKLLVIGGYNSSTSTLSCSCTYSSCYSTTNSLNILGYSFKFEITMTSASVVMVVSQRNCKTTSSFSNFLLVFCYSKILIFFLLALLKLKALHKLLL